MATWQSARAYIESQYRIQDSSENALVMVFDLGDLRSQIVFVSRSVARSSGAEWIDISSPIGTFAEIDLSALLKEVEGLICGGIAGLGDKVVLRHSAPLINLDINELEQPLAMVMNSADNLEKQFGTGDKY